jgi:CHRD domain
VKSVNLFVWRRLVVSALVAALALVLLTVVPVAAQESFFVAELSGAAEVDAEGNPDQGDPDGTGTAGIAIDPEAGTVCWTIEVANIMLPATAAHIHVGAAGVAGDVVITLSPPDATGVADDCAEGQDAATLQAIVDNPAGYYVNVHNEEFPNGAVRGQLTEAPAECVMLAFTEANPEGGEVVTTTVGEPVELEGFFVGGADVNFSLFLGDEEASTATFTADDEGFVFVTVEFEPGDEGVWTIVASVPETECAAEVQVTVLAAPAPPATPTPASPAPLLPNTTSMPQGDPATALGLLLIVSSAAALLLPRRLRHR